MSTERSAAGHLVTRHDCALVVIDVQEKLMPVIWEKEKVLANTSRLVKFAGITGIPVVVTEQEKLGSTISGIRSDLTNSTATVSKICFGCFSCEVFTDRIGRLTGVKTLILAGVEAHICVTQTALQALPSHMVHVVSDAVSSRTEENKAVAIERMRDAGATITSTEMFIYEVLQKAGTTEFKSVLPLVK